MAYLTRLEPREAGLVVELPDQSLAVIRPVEMKGTIQRENEERLLADLIREKFAGEEFSFRKLARSGLNIVSKLSSEKFTYTTDQEGRITEYAYDSRLLGFSIPSGK